MKDARDPAIKLFGKEIPVPENGGISEISSGNRGAEDGTYFHDRRSVIACLDGEKVGGKGAGKQGKEQNEPEAGNEKVQFHSFQYK